MSRIFLSIFVILFVELFVPVFPFFHFFIHFLLFHGAAKTFPTSHQLFLRSRPSFRRSFLNSFLFFFSLSWVAFHFFIGLSWVAIHFFVWSFECFQNIFLKYTVSSFGFVIFPSFSFLQLPLFLLSSSVSCVSICSFFSIPPNSLRDISIVASASMSFSFIVFFSLSTFPLCARYVMSRGIDDLLSTSSDMTAAVIFPSHFILIVFPLIVFV